MLIASNYTISSIKWSPDPSILPDVVPTYCQPAIEVTYVVCNMFAAQTTSTQTITNKKHKNKQIKAQQIEQHKQQYRVGRVCRKVRNVHKTKI